jgi:hypothetical protein
MQSLPKGVPTIVYQSSDPEGANFVQNRGNEASKYLSFIVQHYDNLPHSMVFMQAGHQDWHDPLPKDVTMKHWSWAKARRRGGMAFLPTAAPCLIEDSEEAVGVPLPFKLRVGESPADDCVMLTEHMPRQMHALSQIWDDLFEPELSVMPKRWLTHCCAQFQVTRDAILQHPRNFYERLLEWTLQHDDTQTVLATGHGLDNDDKTRDDAGHLLEITWALIFADRNQVVLEQ